MSEKKLFLLNFQIYGKVQGVFFRKHTQKQAQQLGIRGWCMNTADGTVKGQLEGTQNELNEMKHWLTNKGSPNSRIDKADFGDMSPIDNYTFQSFSIKR